MAAVVIAAAAILPACDSSPPRPTTHEQPEQAIDDRFDISGQHVEYNGRKYVCLAFYGGLWCEREEQEDDYR